MWEKLRLFRDSVPGIVGFDLSLSQIQIFTRFLSENFVENRQYIPGV